MFQILDKFNTTSNKRDCWEWDDDIVNHDEQGVIEGEATFTDSEEEDDDEMDDEEGEEGEEEDEDEHEGDDFDSMDEADHHE